MTLLEVFADVFEAGERYRVHIDNQAPIGGDTQFETFDVGTVGPASAIGTAADDYANEVEVLVEDGDLYLESHKWGQVAKIEHVETNDGATLAQSATVVYERGGA